MGHLTLDDCKIYDWRTAWLTDILIQTLYKHYMYNALHISAVRMEAYG